MEIDPSTLAVLRQVLQFVRLAMFALFIVAGVRVTTAPAGHRRRAINIFLGYTLLAHLAIAIPQNEAWPFSMYPMMAADATDRQAEHRGIFFRAVDSAGREWRVDPLAWSPLFPQAIMGWFEVSWPEATAGQRAAVLKFLLDRAEAARVARSNGERFFGNASILGPLAAPDTNLWGNAAQSQLPYVALRVYRVRWNPTELAASPARSQWQLLGESRR